MIAREMQNYTWNDLVSEYPGEWCALIDVVDGDDRNYPFQTAHLLYHGERNEASHQLSASNNRNKMLICVDTDSDYSLGAILL